MTLPADSHVHSQYSWDCGADPDSRNTMEQSCLQALRIGVPAITFCEHVDLEENWRAEDGDLGVHAARWLATSGRVRLPPFDFGGYMESIERCRTKFPGLRILTGLEIGEPHNWLKGSWAPLEATAFHRVSGSLHLMPFEGAQVEPRLMYRYVDADAVMWKYLEEVERMCSSAAHFEVLCHLDFAARYWPSEQVGPFNPLTFEEGFRSVMRTLADSGRALEMNTRRLWPWLPRWWREEGGSEITFGSDSHSPGTIARNFPEAADMVEQFGFRQGSQPEDNWRR